jgi:hypothetical protein
MIKRVSRTLRNIGPTILLPLIISTKAIFPTTVNACVNPNSQQSEITKKHDFILEKSTFKKTTKRNRGREIKIFFR